MAILLILIFYLEKRKTTLYYIRIGALLTGIGYVLLNVLPADFYSAVIVVILITVGEIFVLPFMNTYWISRTTETNRGSYAALYTMAWSAAQTLGPLGGSQIAGHFGFKWLWFSVGVLCFILALLIRRLKTSE